MVGLLLHESLNLKKFSSNYRTRGENARIRPVESLSRRPNQQNRRQHVQDALLMALRQQGNYRVQKLEEYLKDSNSI